MKKTIIISGPSGVGKRSILEKIINNKDLNLSYSISMTTRKPREGEKHDVDYYFVNNEEFQQAINNDEMVEWAEFCNNKYGTRKSEIKRIIDQNKNPILEIETQGAFQVFNNLNKQEYVSIFISPPSYDELVKRLNRRATESQEIIDKRLTQAKIELEQAKHYDYVIVNDNLQEAVNKLINIIKSNTK